MLSVLNSIAIIFGYIFLAALGLFGAWIVYHFVSFTDVIEWTVGKTYAWRYELWRRDRRGELNDEFLNTLEKVAPNDDVVELIESYK